MNIPMPDRNEKRKSIEYILDQGISKKVSLPVFIRQLYRDIGITYIFHGLSDVIFLALICAAIMNASVLALDLDETVLLLFIVSPMSYALLSSLSIWKEIQLGTYEMKMTCKYTVAHLSAFRMLCFSSVNVLCSTVTVLAVQLIGMNSVLHISALRLFAISLSSLFLYAGITIVILMYAKNRWPLYCLPVIWITVIGLVNMGSRKALQEFVERLPLGVCFIIIVIGLTIYINGIKRMCLKERKGDSRYAYN